LLQEQKVLLLMSSAVDDIPTVPHDWS